MIIKSQQEQPIDMSLRLWSDNVPLRPLLSEMSVEPKYLHVRGQEKINEGRFSGGIADRHYAAIVSCNGDNDEDVAIWLENLLNILENNSNLMENIKKGSISALIWIAVLRRKDAKMPQIEINKINELHKMHLEIMIENYNEFDAEGIPKKTWL